MWPPTLLLKLARFKLLDLFSCNQTKMYVWVRERSLHNRSRRKRCISHFCSFTVRTGNVISIDQVKSSIQIGSWVHGSCGRYTCNAMPSSSVRSGNRRLFRLLTLLVCLVLGSNTRSRNYKIPTEALQWAPLGLTRGSVIIRAVKFSFVLSEISWLCPFLKKDKQNLNQI